MNRTGRGVIGNKPASGTEIIQELGEEHQRTGKWIVYTSADSVFQIAAHEETIRSTSCTQAAARARDPHRQARRRPRHRAAVRRRRRPLRADAEPARLLARAAPAELPDGDPDAGHTVYGVGKISDIFAGATSTSPFRRSRTSTGSTGRSSCSRTSTRARLREPRRDRPALGPSQRPGELPSLPAGLRPSPARTSSTRFATATC